MAKYKSMQTPLYIYLCVQRNGFPILVCTEPWPQHCPTPLRWTGTQTVSQTWSPNISALECEQIHHISQNYIHLACTFVRLTFFFLHIHTHQKQIGVPCLPQGYFDLTINGWPSLPPELQPSLQNPCSLVPKLVLPCISLELSWHFVKQLYTSVIFGDPHTSGHVVHQGNYLPSITLV